MEQRREYQTTELWAVVLAAVLWLIDRWTGTSLFDLVADGQPITEARAQVAAIVAQLHAAAGGNSDLLLYVGGLIYAGRKIEKIVSAWRRPVEPAAER